MCNFRRWLPVYFVSLLLIPIPLIAQDPPSAPLTDRERMLLERMAKLEERVAALELATKPVQPASAAPPPAQVAASPAHLATESATAPAVAPPTFLGGTTFNLNLDAYYGFNFNNPIGRVNLLRSFDVSSNAFSLNQAGIIFDNLPDPDNGKRWGFRSICSTDRLLKHFKGVPATSPGPTSIATSSRLTART